MFTSCSEQIDKWGAPQAHHFLYGKGEWYVQFLGNDCYTPGNATPSPNLQVTPLQQYPALLWAQDSAYQAQQGRFAGAVWPQQANHFAFIYLYMYIVKQRLAVVAEGDAIDLQERRNEL